LYNISFVVILSVFVNTLRDIVLSRFLMMPVHSVSRHFWLPINTC